jgi:hypothetical protein
MHKHRSSFATSQGRWAKVETPPGAAWIVVADQAEESAARLIVAHAALNGEATALALAEKQMNILIQIFPLVNLNEDALIACPNTGRKVSIEMTTAFDNLAPVVCQHCGETHAWAVKNNCVVAH